MEPISARKAASTCNLSKLLYSGSPRAPSTPGRASPTITLGVPPRAYRLDAIRHAQRWSGKRSQAGSCSSAPDSSAGYAAIIYLAYNSRCAFGAAYVCDRRPDQQTEAAIVPPIVELPSIRTGVIVRARAFRRRYHIANVLPTLLSVHVTLQLPVVAPGPFPLGEGTEDPASSRSRARLEHLCRGMYGWRKEAPQRKFSFSFVEYVCGACRNISRVRTVHI